MKRKTKTLLCLMLSLCLLLCAAPLQAAAVKQEDIDALKAQRDAIEARRLEKQAVVDQLEAEQADVLEQKRALDERNLYTYQQIQINNEEIALYDEMIAEKEEELLGAQKLEQDQLERYRARVRAMEENGTLNYLAMILKANNLGELLSAIDDIGEIMLSDRKLEDAYIQARENTEEVKAEYEEYRAEVNGKQDALRREKVKLEAELEEAGQLLLSIQEDLENHQAEYDAIIAEEERTEAAINKLVAQLEAERAEAARKAAEEAAARAAAQGGGGGGGSSGGTAYAGATGSFVFPVASYVYISSRFGQRVHPITGELKNHNGMDIASNMGTTVYAADGGKVVLAEWYGGYGNCIMIDHGNGYKTLYGHLSAIGVSEGQNVSQGAVIGAVGSTGNSTGPHLHFEVYANDSRIDPEQFYSGLVFSQDAGV
ncbi:MAG: peptidoglycan DD-metalloendopeptidase family protein [Eubacteriales bacterium]|nr:peptidoglycan DD-metalloendopeptidase family protein [Eubacteriales bacterium]